MDPTDTFHLSPTNKAEAVKYFHRAIDMGIDFKLRDRILDFKNFEELFEIAREQIPHQGMDMEALHNFVEKSILPYSTNYASPLSMAFPDAGNSIAGISGSILASFINQNLINWFPCSPMGTIIEMQVINWFRELVGYPLNDKLNVPLDAGGFVTSGGVASNTVAMLLAREKALPGCISNGLHHVHKNVVCIVPEGIDHYSSRLSIGWLGLGTSQVVKAKTKNFKYDLEALEQLIFQLVKQGKLVMSLTAYAGDSRSMTCDDFPALRKICDSHNIWLHIDGCHGTQLLFSKNLRKLVKGMELADSITFDPHKVLTLPYAISLILVKNTDVLKSIKQPEDIIMGEDHSFGQITPFYGSRPFQSLKLYMLLKHMGFDGIGRLIEQRCKLAAKFADIIRQDKDFKLINSQVHINSVMFMYVPETFTVSHGNIDVLNSINSRIQKALLEAGSVWLHNFEIPDSSNVFGLGVTQKLRPLRYMSGNPVTTERNLFDMIEQVRKLGETMPSFKTDDSLDNTFNICKISTEIAQSKPVEQYCVPPLVSEWIAQTLSMPKFLGKATKPGNYKSLSMLLPEMKDSLLSDYIALQTVSFLKSCTGIPTIRFGNFIGPKVASEFKWSTYVQDFICGLAERTKDLDSTEQKLFGLYIQKLNDFFSAESTVELLNSRRGVLVPTNFDPNRIIVNNVQRLDFSNHMSFISGDILFGYGGFLSRLFQTSLGDAFLLQCDDMPETDRCLIHAYSMLHVVKDALMNLRNTTASASQKTLQNAGERDYIRFLEKHQVHLFKIHTLSHKSIRNCDEISQAEFLLDKEASGQRVSSVIKMIRDFCNSEFCGDTEAFYTIIYGSFAYGMAQTSSDIDILFVSETADVSKKSRVAEFIVSLHDVFGCRKDNEIPYENKSLMSTDFIKSAVEGGGTFLNGRWKFPVIEKNPEYLTSEKLLQRFVQGMLVNPHIFVAGNFKLYSAHRTCATVNTIKGVMCVNNIRSTDAISLAKSFCIGPSGQTGDFFLGFSYKEPFISYLLSHLEATLSIMKCANKRDTKHVYEFRDEEVYCVDKVENFAV